MTGVSIDFLCFLRGWYPYKCCTNGSLPGPEALRVRQSCENSRVKMEARQRRALRGSAAASFATFVALTSHVIGGGSLPTIMGLIVPLVLSILVCVLLAGRRLSLWRLCVSVSASQALFHLLFSVFAPTASAPGAVNAIERHGMHHGGAGGLMPGPMADSVAPSQAMHSHASLPMLLAHLVAAVLTIAMIYWAEQLPAALAEFARLVIRALVPVLAVIRSIPDGPLSQPAIAEVVPRTLGVLRSPVLRRGPPQPAF